MASIVNRAEELLIAGILAAMTLLTFVQVVLRYAFNSGLVWALEATTYMFGWLVLFGMSYGVKKGSHIGMDALVKTLSPAWQRLVGLAAVALCILYVVIMLYGSYVYVDTMHTLGVEAEDIAIERWILVSILPIGFALLLLRLVQTALRILTHRQDGFRLADEARETIDQLHGDGVADRKGS